MTFSTLKEKLLTSDNTSDKQQDVFGFFTLLSQSLPFVCVCVEKDEEFSFSLC